jgi:hypothetical protein
MNGNNIIIIALVNYLHSYFKNYIAIVSYILCVYGYR